MWWDIVYNSGEELAIRVIELMGSLHMSMQLSLHAHTYHSKCISIDYSAVLCTESFSFIFVGPMRSDCYDGPLQENTLHSCL